MQLGVRDDAAAARAEAAGGEVVMDRCPKIEYGRLFGEIGWLGVNRGIISAKRGQAMQLKTAKGRLHQQLSLRQGSGERIMAYGFETLAVHAGAAPDPTTGARAVPIYQTTVLRLRRRRPCRVAVQPAAVRQHLHPARPTRPSRCWRSGSPRSRAAPPPAAAASGHAAQFLAFFNLMSPGDDIVASSSRLYGGSITQLTHTFPQFGWEVRSSTRASPRTSAGASTPHQGALPRERCPTPAASSPTSRRSPAIAHEAGRAAGRRQHAADALPVPAARWGADIVVHSMTKYLGGQGNSIGGVIVEGGKFDWAATASSRC